MSDVTERVQSGFVVVRGHGDDMRYWGVQQQESSYGRCAGCSSPLGWGDRTRATVYPSEGEADLRRSWLRDASVRIDVIGPDRAVPERGEK